MLLSFFQFEKVSDINDERFIWSHDFRGFSPWSVGSFALRLHTKQKHDGWRMCRRKLLISWHPCSRESKSGKTWE